MANKTKTKTKKTTARKSVAWWIRPETKKHLEQWALKTATGMESQDQVIARALDRLGELKRLSDSQWDTIKKQRELIEEQECQLKHLRDAAAKAQADMDRLNQLLAAHGLLKTDC